MKPISKKLLLGSILEFLAVMIFMWIGLSNNFLGSYILEIIFFLIIFLGTALFLTMLVMIDFYEKLEKVSKKDWIIVYLLALFLMWLGLIPFIIGVYLYRKRRFKQESIK
ncbi:hypothetical protein YN1_5460 [Nanoarchaeota archaeon]